MPPLTGPRSISGCTQHSAAAPCWAKLIGPAGWFSWHFIPRPQTKHSSQTHVKSWFRMAAQKPVGYDSGEKGGISRPLLARSVTPASMLHVVHRVARPALLREHGHLGHLQRAVVVHLACHLHVMPLMALHGIGICDVD